MFNIVGVSNNRAQLLHDTATCDDLETANTIGQVYHERGLIARIYNAETRTLIAEYPAPEA